MSSLDRILRDDILVSALQNIRDYGRIVDTKGINEGHLPGAYRILTDRGYIKKVAPGKYQLLTDKKLPEKAHEPRDTDQESPEIENTDTLRRMLLQTIEDVKDNKIDLKKAKVIAELSGKVIDSAKVDVAYYIAQKRLGGQVAPLALTHGD